MYVLALKGRNNEGGISFVTPFQGSEARDIAYPGRCPGLICCPLSGCMQAGGYARKGAVLMGETEEPAEPVLRRMAWPIQDETVADALLTREWLVTNGLGGYASGTVGGVPTRRYHGLLIASLPAPLGRMMMLNHLSEQVRKPDGTLARFGGQEWVGGRLEMDGAGHLVEFRLESGLPVWCFQIDRYKIEKRVLLAHQLNTVYVAYRLTAGEGTLRLKLRPAVHFRHHDGSVNTPLAEEYTLTAVNDRCELSAGPNLPHLRLQLHGLNRAFTIQGQRLSEVLYRSEESRGYDAAGELWTPGYYRVDLSLHSSATLVVSTEAWDVVQALNPEQAQAAEHERRDHLLEKARAQDKGEVHAELVLAADQFVMLPMGRVEDAARAHAAGDEERSVIAGYHWFTDWGRDTMISLEGLALTTGRHQEAGYILRTFARYVRDGLIPNFFPDGKNDGVYHTADATLWYFHALDRYVETTGDRATLMRLLPVLQDIVAHHVRGTRFGIGVDPSDGLLRQGQDGYQLTWMDAKVGNWVVTPRRGKAVEINGLWHNALCLLESWVRALQGETDAQPLGEQAARVRDSFNKRFWNPETNYLYDVVDGEGGNDPACRPNQLLSISLRFPVLDPARWKPVLETVRQQLLTPVGLRSLAPGHPDYKSHYFGDLRSRDAAYHQGTVWAWLIGPFIDAWLKTYPDDRAGARRWLEGFVPHLSDACIGSISEVFDAEKPFTPRGCIAQAWSVAEVLRCWALTKDEG
jgi:predicted glycogen debranching enzyme